MKRCKDCKWFGFCFNEHFAEAEDAVNEGVFNPNDVDCGSYERKFWKFWRPK